MLFYKRVDGMDGIDDRDNRAKSIFCPYRPSRPLCPCRPSSIVHFCLILFFTLLCQLHAQNSEPPQHPVKTIAIVCYKDNRMAAWDPESVKEGVAGSEEAVIFMAQELANLGYQVTVFAQPPEGSKHSFPTANPRYVAADATGFGSFDVAVAWRMPWKAKELKTRANKVYHWPHDVPNAHVTDEQIRAFDGTLWLSNWQRELWASDAPAWGTFDTVFGNGINEEQFHGVKERDNPHSCIYGSNYARGLEQMLDLWPKVREKYSDATLDIYYGWQTWGLISPEKEAKMRAAIQEMAALGVQEHGRVGHDELNRAYEKASLWTYPCTLPETFCITALRAQLSGAIPVIVEGSALQETVPNGFKCKTQEEYLPLLLEAMKKAETTTVEERKKMGEFVTANYTWEKVAKKWADLFEKNHLFASQEPDSTQKPKRLIGLRPLDGSSLKFVPIIVLYGANDNSRDVTDIAIAQFMRNSVLLVPPDANFNELFGASLDDSPKSLVFKVGTHEYIIPEKRDDYVFVDLSGPEKREKTYFNLSTKPKSQE